MVQGTRLGVVLEMPKFETIRLGDVHVSRHVDKMLGLPKTGETGGPGVHGGLTRIGPLKRPDTWEPVWDLDQVP